MHGAKQEKRTSGQTVENTLAIAALVKEPRLTICAFVCITTRRRHQLLIASCLRITVAFLWLGQSPLGG